MYALTFKNDHKVLDLVESLSAFFGGAEFTTEEVLLVKTDDPRMKAALHMLVESAGVGIVFDPGGVSGAEVAASPVVRDVDMSRGAFSPDGDLPVDSLINVPKCERCGAALERGPRGYSKFCNRIDCKRARWREQQATRKVKKLANVAPVVEDVKPDTVPFEQS
jgi:hypothetical protein